MQQKLTATRPCPEGKVKMVRAQLLEDRQVAGVIPDHG
jgi:hypothetical protein